VTLVELGQVTDRNSHKKCGLDAVKAVRLEEHMKLLTNIRKVTSSTLCCTLYKLQ
jgi:hypothetical protein